MITAFDYSKVPVSEIFGIYCFSDDILEKELPNDLFQQFLTVKRDGGDLKPEVAHAVAQVMKKWALSMGATHFTHWFQPLTDSTAEKHDAFLAMENGHMITVFSGQELMQGEPDASSFPNGGLRATFEARGYTAWDVSSPVFIKETEGVKTLYIPTAFFSFNGQALDKKVPLLRSCDAMERQTLRVLRALGNTQARHVYVSVGAEQEYFLVDRHYYEQRPDLRFTGRTVFGNLGAKGQELDDHYYGSVNDRVTVFMSELNHELWKVGIPARTQHKEVAPGQFELAVVHDPANLATDRNQLLMRILKSVARRHGMKALLHEKPFAGVNGSGKHNNWSFSTDDGQNLLVPGESPEDNIQFLLMLTSVIKAVDLHASLIRSSAATAGNDHRLGRNEAPTSIISIYLGEQLQEILEHVASDTPYRKRDGQRLQLGITTLPQFPKDMTDRNRTSPFAFTGNKFEFRMVGSSQSVSTPNTYLNAAVADVLGEVADRLEKADNPTDEAIHIIKEFYQAHKRIVFNGNGYSEEWRSEAHTRGLPNFEHTVDALVQMTTPENVAMLTRQRVYTIEELESHLEVYLQTFSKQINIEAGVMLEMAQRSILPAVRSYLAELCGDVNALKNLQLPIDTLVEIATSIATGLDTAYKFCQDLNHQIKEALLLEHDPLAQATYYKDELCQTMRSLRLIIDNLENLTGKDAWPFPSYEELLFRL